MVDDPYMMNTLAQQESFLNWIASLEKPYV